MTVNATMFDLAQATTLVVGALCVAWTIASVITTVNTKAIVKVKR